MEVTGGQTCTFQLEIGKSYCLTSEFPLWVDEVLVPGHDDGFVAQSFFVASKATIVVLMGGSGQFHLTEIK